MDERRRQMLLEKDRKYIWHPFTQMKDYAHRDHILIERAEGPFLYGADGQRYYDTVSSWWLNVHGHNHPRLNQAVRRQLEDMEHVIFSGFTHAPAIELAERLVAITPPGLDKVFYSDNGSTSVEVALKMSFQYWQQVGRPQKTRFAFLENGYHGDTLGAVSVGGVEMYHSLYRPLLFEAYRLPSPYRYRWPGENGEAVYLDEAVAAVESLFEEHGDTIAALIVEPMVQAAGGMIVYPAEYLKRVRELCDRYEIHLIADEVAVGFGRTGEMFACNHAAVRPDIMCLSKALTGGYMPLAATLCTQTIYDAFYDDYETMKTFYHGHSFTGNPTAAAVAVENLKIFEEEKTLEHVRILSAILEKELPSFQAFDHVGDIRHIGVIAAFEIVKDKQTKESFDFRKRVGHLVYQEGLKNGLLLRPLGDIIYYWLPYCLREEQLYDILERTRRVFRNLSL
jgi:adenosylmethionine-8-amino-7-oxononanoate aminotransferase